MSSSGAPSAPQTAAATATLSAAAFENLEHRYADVMRDLSAEPHLEAFKHEYEKIHRLLHKSYEGEKRLIQKVNELEDEVQTHNTKIDTAMQLSHEDEQSISSLRKEIEKAWAMADAAHAREKESKEMIQALKRQVSDLDSLVEKSAGLSVGQEAYLRDLLVTKKERGEELEIVSAKHARLSAEHRDCVQKLKKSQAHESSIREELERKMEAYQALLADLEAQQKDRLAKEQSVRECRSTSEQCIMDLERQRETLERLTRDEAQLRQRSTSSKDEEETLLRQLEEQQRRFSAEAERLASLEHKNTALRKEIPKRQAQLKEREAELAKVTKQLAALDSGARAQQEELRSLVVSRDEAILKNNAINEELNLLVAELHKEEQSLQLLEGDVKVELQKKARTLNENSSKEAERASVEGRKAIEESKSRRLAQSLEALLSSNERMRRQVFVFEQSLGKEVTAAQANMLGYHKTLDHIRTQRSHVKSLREMQAMNEKKMKVQQELLDRVASDRNRTEKELRETELEWRRLQQRHASKQEEVNVTKGEVVRVEGALCQLHLANRKLQQDVTSTELRATHLRDDNAHAQQRIQSVREQVMQLEQVVANCDAEKAKQTQRLSAIVSERNVLASQLLRRTEELDVLYDKLQLQQSQLEKGANDYDAAVDAIAMSCNKLQEMRLRCRLSLVRLRLVDRLAKRERQVSRALVAEQARVRALTDELEGPVNIHRWRRLDGGDGPELMDALAKVQMVQRKLLSKSDECAAKAKLIEQKEVEYTQLRERLARLPGPEAAEDLALYHENIEKRQEQIQSMAQELEDVEQHAEVLADEVQQLNEELCETKKRYYEAKTKNDLLLREQRALRRTWGDPRSAVGQVARSSRSAPPQSNFAQTAPQLGDGAGLASSTVSAGGGGSRRIVGASTTDTLCASGTSAPHSSSGGGPAGAGQKKGGGRLAGLRAASQQPTKRQRIAAKEEELLQVLSTGQPAANFPLQKPKQQRQFVGGGFSLNRV